MLSLWELNAAEVPGDQGTQAMTIRQCPDGVHLGAGNKFRFMALGRPTAAAVDLHSSVRILRVTQRLEGNVSVLLGTHCTPGPASAETQW